MSLREVGTGIFIATSRRDSLNSVVVAAGESEPEVLLIDPGWEPATVLRGRTDSPGSTPIDATSMR